MVQVFVPQRGDFCMWMNHIALKVTCTHGHGGKVIFTAQLHAGNIHRGPDKQNILLLLPSLLCALLCMNKTDCPHVRQRFVKRSRFWQMWPKIALIEVRSGLFFLVYADCLICDSALNCIFLPFLTKKGISLRSSWDFFYLLLFLLSLLGSISCSVSFQLLFFFFPRNLLIQTQWRCGDVCNHSCDETVIRGGRLKPAEWRDPKPRGTAARHHWLVGHLRPISFAGYNEIPVLSPMTDSWPFSHHKSSSGRLNTLEFRRKYVWHEKEGAHVSETWINHALSHSSVLRMSCHGLQDAIKPLRVRCNKYRGGISRRSTSQLAHCTSGARFRLTDSLSERECE